MLKDDIRWLEIKGASEHNLKNIDIKLPHDHVTVVTGISGSGKSSLAYDLIFRECQRRYLEGISSYTRQFMDKTGKANLESIKGMRPAMAVSQKNVRGSSRSTIGTITGIYDWLRLLFARYAETPDELQSINNRALFSFNSAHGACENCRGLGVIDKIDEDKLIKDASLTIREGAFEMTTPSGYIVYSQVTMDVLDQVCQSEGFSVDIPWQDLQRNQQEIILYGSQKLKVPFGKHTLESRMKWSGITAKPREEGYYKGIMTIMEDILKRDRNKNILRFAKTVSCPACKGKRLRPEALEIKYIGYNISDLSEQNFTELEFTLQNIISEVTDKHQIMLISNILKKVKLAVKLGLGHLSCSRSSENISGGEGQRLKILSIASSKMRDMIYVFDEPSTGLHQAELASLQEVLRDIKNNGNTVIIVEHDPLMIKAADWIIDIGPLAGTEGGELIFCGWMKDFLASSSQSKTLEILHIENQTRELSQIKERFKIIGANANNLKCIDISFAINRMNVITGVSGAGKTTLMERAVLPSLIAESPIGCSELDIKDKFQRIICIDQKAIGRSPRSNAATYTGLMDELRSFYSKTEKAKEMNLKRGDFSFNTKGGRCENCEGAGAIKLGMHFLDDIMITCPKCKGKRFKPEVLEVLWQNHTITEILDLTIKDILKIYPEKTKGYRVLSTLDAVGLGYLSLGQPATTISGGEAQRIKLATDLAKSTSRNTLYFLDEPTTGLHGYDVIKLMEILNDLVRKGNTVILIENDPIVINYADHVIELGPEGGQKGGYLQFEGNLDKLIREDTLTAKVLREEIFIAETNHYNPPTENICFHNVQTNNLKGIYAEFKRNQFNVVCGLSGSGKSSLVFDTVYAEGWQSYIENLPSYSSRMLSIKRGEVESFEGLGAVVAIKQEKSQHTRRSTIGTFSGIYDHLRLLYSRMGKGKRLTASHFSFNNHDGACEYCNGLGSQPVIDAEKLITNPEKSIFEGAMHGTKRGKFYGDAQGQYLAILQTIEQELGFDLHVPFKDLEDEQRDVILYGCGDREFDVNWEFKRGNRSGVHNFKGKWLGFIPLLNEEYDRVHEKNAGKDLKNLLTEKTCEHCNGRRLKPEVLEVTVAGYNIAELCRLELTDLRELFTNFKFGETKEISIWKSIGDAIIEKLNTIIEAGLGYISLERSLNTLSGGEYQRLRLALQLVSELSGVTYILDEVSRGLHHTERIRLVEMIRKLVLNNNTLIAVEHDPLLIKSADHILELGPEAGSGGGNIIAQGNPQEIINDQRSRIRPYLNEELAMQNRHTRSSGSLVLENCYVHNLDINKIEIPMGMLVGICGISGSGKTSLCEGVIYASSNAKKPVGCSNISGLDQFDKVIFKQQKSLNVTISSTPATYLGILNKIGKLIAKETGAKAKIFNYAGKEGQCRQCKGSGVQKTELDFAGTVSSLCDACDGRRYNSEVLEYKYKGLNIAEILDLSINEAMEFFADNKKINHSLEVATDLGLGYIKLGQHTKTLSGGEAQRLILAESLISLKKDARCLIILDEPASGLHPLDVENIGEYLLQLSNKHSVIFIEHNQKLLSYADRLIELGPGSGKNGGRVVGREEV